MARNAGVAASHGELLVFLDDDDIWHPDRLRRQVAELSSDPDAVACYSSAWYIDAVGARLPGGWSATSATREQFLSGAIDIPSFVSLMVRRDPFIAVGCFNTAFKLAEDNEWILRMLRYGRFVCSRDALVGYRRHGNNVSNARLTEHVLWSRRAILLQLWAGEARANEDDQRLMRQNWRAFRRRCAEASVGTGLASVKSGNALRAAGDFARAFHLSAPRAGRAATIRLARFIRKQWATDVRLPILKHAAAYQPDGDTTFGRSDAQRAHTMLRVGAGQEMRHDTDVKSSQEP